MTTPVSTTVDRGRLKIIADRLREDYGAGRVILFGSAAHDMVTEHSDIDLLVIAETSERFYERAASVLRTVRVFWRGAHGCVVLDPKRTLVTHRRTDFGRMKPKWFIEIARAAVSETTPRTAKDRTFLTSLT